MVTHGHTHTHTHTHTAKSLTNYCAKYHYTMYYNILTENVNTQINIFRSENRHYTQQHTPNI